MNSDQIEEVVEKQFYKCKELLTKKAAEYAPVDRLHNFRVAAELQGVSLEKALGGMMAKHTVSLYDLIERGESPWSDLWDEKIDDHINYLILLQAILWEGRMNSETPEGVDV